MCLVGESVAKSIPYQHKIEAKPETLEFALTDSTNEDTGLAADMASAIVPYSVLVSTRRRME